MRYKSSLLFSVLFIWILSGCADQSSDQFSFTILQLNDVYEIAPLDNGKTAGLARVATLRSDLIKQNPNTITMLAGDFLSPSLIGNLKIDGQRVKGKHMVEVLNAVGLDYVTFGNHEFDISEEDLQSRLNESKFSWTTANTFHQLDTSVVAFQVNGESIPRYIIHEMTSATGQPVKLGIISVTLPFNQADHVNYSDVFKSFDRVYKEIETRCDAIIGLTHLNIEDDLKLAEQYPKLLMVLGGHDHTNMKHVINDVVVTKADANAKTAYVHDITLDMGSGKSQVESKLLPINDELAEDADVKKIVDKWMELSNANLTSLGYQPDALIFTTSDTLDVLETSVRNHQTNFTNIVVAAMAYGSSSADAVVINSGSIRLDDLLTGNIYEYDILKTFPYGGPLVIGQIPGKALKDVAAIGKDENKDTGGYLQMWNITLANDNWYVGDEVIDDQKEYAVVLPKFVMEGNEQNLEFLKDLNYTEPEKLGPNGVRNDIRDIFIDYKRNN